MALHCLRLFEIYVRVTAVKVYKKMNPTCDFSLLLRSFPKAKIDALLKKLQPQHVLVGVEALCLLFLAVLGPSCTMMLLRSGLQSH